jgi:xanthine dehydrogenase accessory factor
VRDGISETVRQWTAAGDRVTLATVAEAKKSAPQPVGTKMAINSAGRVSGAVSGGCVEGAVVEVAEQIMAGAPAQLLRYGIADEDAWEVGLPCGGEIAVWVENYRPGTLQAEFLRLGLEDRRAVLITPVPVGPDGAASAGDRRLLLTPDSEQGTLGSAELDAAALEHGRRALWRETSELVELPGFGLQLFVDSVAPQPKLIIVGAVDFAAQLATAARLAGWRPFVVDPRARFATPERFPDAERVIAAWPQEAFPQICEIDPATAIAVLTHDPKLDDAALAVALASEAAYIGAMGSRRAQERRRARLLEAGVGEAELDRISAPIGLDLGARSAGETALSIMSEIVALKHHRAGGRLQASRGRIHELAA